MKRLISATYVYTFSNMLACGMVFWYSFRPFAAEDLADFVLKLCLVGGMAIVLHYAGYMPLIRAVYAKRKEYAINAGLLPKLEQIRQAMEQRIGMSIPLDGEKKLNLLMVLSFFFVEITLAIYICVAIFFQFAPDMPSFVWQFVMVDAVFTMFFTFVFGIRLAAWFKQLGEYGD